MRISDWSSAVCSSDLSAPAGHFECFMHQKVIARAATNGDCRAGHGSAVMHGAKFRPSCVHAGHDVANIGDRQLPVLFCSVRIDGETALLNLETNHVLSDRKSEV